MYSAAIRTCCNIFLFVELMACIIYLVSGPFCGSYILISLERIYIYVVRKFEEALCISFLHCRCLVSTRRICPLGCWIQAWNKRILPWSWQTWYRLCAVVEVQLRQLLNEIGTFFSPFLNNLEGCVPFYITEEDKRGGKHH